MLPDEHSHGRSICRNGLRHKNSFTTGFGLGSPVLPKTPQSKGSTSTYRTTRLATGKNKYVLSQHSLEVVRCVPRGNEWALTTNVCT